MELWMVPLLAFGMIFIAARIAAILPGPKRPWKLEYRVEGSDQWRTAGEYTLTGHVERIHAAEHEQSLNRASRVAVTRWRLET